MSAIVRHSKKLSWLLRHGAIDAGLSMDAAGWARIDDVLRLTGMSRSTLAAVVRDNDKRRLQVYGERIRCTQGHSLEGTPVTLEALEASWKQLEPAGTLVHGTSVDAASRIAVDGIHPMRRTHVHLAADAHSKVGKRANVHLLLEIDPRRLDAVWISPNGVYLTREVPVHAIVGVHPKTRRAHQALDALRAQLGV